MRTRILKENNMSISDQDWSVIRSMEHANAQACRANSDSNSFAMKIMVEHMKRDHEISSYEIAKSLGMKRREVEKILAEKES